MTEVATTPARSFPTPLPDQEAPESPGTPGPAVELNAFQILMRRWSQLHPYSAGQVMKISGPADRDRWKAAIEKVIHAVGLGKPHFGQADQTVRFVPVGEVPVEQSGQDLQSFFNEELNRPFAAGDLPIRFCTLPAAGEKGGGTAHYLAAIYDHWIADSRAMRELMQRTYLAYRDAEASAEALPALTLQAPPFRRLFAKHFNGFMRLTGMRESLRNIWDHRKAYRLNLWVPMDFNSRFLYRQLPEGLIERLHRFAKSKNASVNDLFIAVIGQSMGAYTAEDRLGRAVKPLHFSRRQIGIGTIVDIRDAASEPLDRVFGLYLSSYQVLLDNPEQRSAEDLAREVGAKTREIKKNGTVRTFFGLMIARFWYDMHDSARFRATLLHKTVPVVAGISNVNMTRSWADSESNDLAGSNGSPEAHDQRPRVLDYLRISPTGPLIPLVFTLTTIRGRLSLCVTWRTTSFHEDKLVGVVDDFVSRLEAIAAEPC